MVQIEILLILEAVLILMAAIVFVKYKSNKELKSFIELLNDSMNTPGHGLVLFDEKGVMRFANKQARAYIPDLEQGSLKNANCREFVNFLFDHAIDLDPALKQALDKSGKRTPFEGFREVFQWGDDQAKLCMGEMIETSKGAHILVLTDVSQHKRSEDQNLALLQRSKNQEQELAQAQKLDALGKMAAGVAHDFNNILSIIDGYARIGQKKYGPDDLGHEYFKKIVQASARGASLTRQMLTFSRQKIIQNEVVNLGKVLSEQLHLFQAAITSVVELDVNVEEDNLCIECSQDDVTQIFMNLIINAADAMPHGGKIKINVKAQEGESLPSNIVEKLGSDVCIKIEVKDEGSGIPPDVLEKIFDPFFTTKDTGKGTGLGLSLVYGLINQIGGHIEVQSKLKAGTTFKIYIPRSARTEEKEISGSLEDMGNLSFKGYTIMVVDDEEEIRMIMADILGDFGFNVITAEGGNEALAKQEEILQKIDVLITDVMMPGLDGVRLAKLFAALRPETPIIFMSGYPESGKKTSVSAPEGSLSITKPVDFMELTKMVFSILNDDHPDHTQMLTSSKWALEEDVEEVTEKRVGGL